MNRESELENILKELKLKLEKERKTSVFDTVNSFWDCNCEFDYINQNRIKKCNRCGAEREDCSSSRATEVKIYLLTEFLKHN